MKRTFSVCLTILLLALILTPTVFAWELERPSDHITIDQRRENSTTDGNASVGLGVHVAGYRENWPVWPSDGDDDIVDLYIVATGNTRKIVNYVISNQPYWYEWHDENELPNQIYLQDDQVVFIPLPFKVRFYGGPGSAEYEAVWLSSNGFLIFYDPLREAPYPYQNYPASIPNTTVLPNNFVAPFWRDLKPNEGGMIKIKYGYVVHMDVVECVAISWNATDAYGNPQIFQVLIERASYVTLKRRQSRMWFQYKSITLNDPTTVGIEDQQGAKGASYNYQDLQNEMALMVEQSSNSAFINRLKITLSENEANASTKIDENKESRRGYNVILNQSLGVDESERYLLALEGSFTLLATAWQLADPTSPYAKGAGIIVDWVFIGIGSSSYLARQQAAETLLQTDDYTYAIATAVEDTVDASFGILVYWVLTDANNEDHDLTVTAELEYDEYNSYGQLVASTTIPTSADLKLTHDSNNDFDTAKEIPSSTYSPYSNVYLGGDDIEDYFQVYAEAGQEIKVTLSSPADADFDLYLYDPSRTQRDSSTRRGNGLADYITFSVDSNGYWFFKTVAIAGSGYYSGQVQVYYPPPDGPPPPGGGCPTLFTWNGTVFVKEDVLNIHSEIDIDVTLNYTLKTMPIPEHNMYILKLAEIADGYNYSHSFIDHVKLYLIDGDGVWHESHLTSANHSRHGNVMRKLLLSDDKRTETLQNDEITLKFIIPPIWTTSKAFAFIIEGHNPLKT